MGDIIHYNEDRATGRAVVTGAATYAAEHDVAGVTYGVLATSTIGKGKIMAIDTKAAERSPGVLAVISHMNAEKIPGEFRGLQIFDSGEILFNGQPIALVIADTFERATYAASLIKCQYDKQQPDTDFSTIEKEATAKTGPRYKDTMRGDVTAWKSAPVVHEESYIIPIEVHNPMEIHAIIARWDSPEKITVYTKTQGVVSSQKTLAGAFKLKAENVQVYAPFVGGGFGSALRTWPHEIAAVMGAKKVGKPVKLLLTRNQMFTMVGYRPYTLQKIGLGAQKDGTLVGISHIADANTSMYEEHTEGAVNVSKNLYATPNLLTKYHIHPYNIGTPTWMRGPGEATGCYALESALDELSYKLKIDPIALRLKNYAEKDPESGKPFSSNFLKEAYQLGADAIGWNKRKAMPKAEMQDGMLVGYGMAGGLFNANRGKAAALAKILADGSLVVQSAVSDSGPGTSTSMAIIAAEVMGLPLDKVVFELGDSSLPPGPTQGGSTTTSTLGSAVFKVCTSLKEKLAALAAKNTDFSGTKPEDLRFENGMITLVKNPTKKISYAALLQANNLSEVEATEDSGPNEVMKNYAAFSYSVHFVKLLVHPLTGMVKLDKIVVAGDAGKIISMKTAESQMIGGAVGGIGMALTEEGVLDNRYGRWINNNFADYHVPVYADVPEIKALFVNKPDPYLNPMGAKGMGEIALIGFAAAVTNAIYNATGIRVRDLPVTPDKLV